MKHRFILAACAAMAVAGSLTIARAETPRWSIVIHGGAGVIDRAQLSPDLDAAYRAALDKALAAGAKILAEGGAGLDAIEATITLMEDDPLFNAGRGAVFSAEGRNELDASIMEGTGLKAGAVAGLRTTRHPISAARAVMEKSPHVLLAGADADRFAASNGLEQVKPGYFFTERRWQGLVRFLAARGEAPPKRPRGVPKAAKNVAHTAVKAAAIDSATHGFGTVGVAVMDQKGQWAAGTSTGGTTGKRWGRVGDAPIIGAGTYAQDGICAVSATGTGEYFLRLGVARRICALVELRGLSIQAALRQVITSELTALGGDGGVIAIGPRGETAFGLNTSGMYRARLDSAGDKEISIFADEGDPR